jgi:putative DNA primase/helicase
VNTNYFNRRESANIELESSNDTGALQVPTAVIQTDSDSLPLTVTVFKNEKDNVPVSQELTWAELRDRYFKAHQKRMVKTGGMAISPVSYMPGTTRGNQSVDAVFCAVFDIEHHGPFEALQERLDGYAFLAHSSYRHKPEDPRYRIILPLAKPVYSSEWSHAWAKLNYWVGGVNDPSTKDPARIYFLPSRPPEAPGHFIVAGQGVPVDIESLPDLPPAAAARTAIAPQSTDLKYRIEGIEEMPPDPLSPAEGLGRVVRRCKFMTEASQPEAQKNVSRPLWRAMISNAVRFEDSEGWIHEASCHHNGYRKAETDSTIKGCRDFGAPITCANIQESGFGGCPLGGCTTSTGKVTKAPAGLWMGSEAHTPGGQSDSQPKTGRPEYLPEAVVQFLDKSFPDGLMYTNEGFLGYEKGYWKRLEDRADVLHKIAVYRGKSVYKPKQIKDLFEILKDFLAKSEADLAPDRSLICLRNGTLDSRTYSLISHSPAHKLTNKLDIDWDPAASCRRWLAFLDQIFVNDADKLTKIQFLQEWFGYCLLPDVSQHKFLWLVGAGGNGKSVLLSILTALVGAGNVSHAYMERLDKAYVRAELEGKLINISSEMSAEATISDGYFKAIVAGDVLEAERKFKPPFSFRPYVRLIGATNHLPRLLDLSDGFFRRAVVLTFNRQFTGSEIDPALEGKLLGELAGILTWAMQGLQQLRARGCFEVPASSISALARYRVDSDPMAVFAEECLDQVDLGGMQSGRIYEGYSEWCRRNGFARKSSVGFGKHLAELGFVSYRSSSGNCWRVKPKQNNAFLWEEGDMDTAFAPERVMPFIPRYKL